jgi:PAS domain S-box-containing protein
VDVPDEDEASVIPLANFFAVALRNERLHRETTLLRDYQARLIEYANALILGVDRHFRIAVANRALCSLLGFSHGELIGKDIRDWLPAEQRQRLAELVRAGLGDGELRPKAADAVEVELPTRAGPQVRTVWWSVATIMRQGELQAVVAIGQDQTRLRDLQNQVVQAEKLATLGQLAAGVVHEINNPLTSISVYSAAKGNRRRVTLAKRTRPSCGASAKVPSAS